MIDIEKLEYLATAAIEKNNFRASPFSRLNKKPIVQIGSRTLLPNSFQIPRQYLGYHNGMYVYNLEAEAILRYVKRHKAEFMLTD